MKKVFSLLTFCIFFLTGPTAALAWPGTVVAVSDGDTFTVCRADGTKEKIRLFGVDCPESQAKGRWEAQPYNRRATEFLRDLFRDPATSAVAIWEVGDSYGRIVAGVILLHSGTTVQEELLKAGLAWVDPRFCKRSIKECKSWMVLEQEAARERRGLWLDLDNGQKPVAPWKWRTDEQNDEKSFP